jgi:D-glycero-D-manno-heptose 1,7-bisphosphate phosphatase
VGYLDRPDAIALYPYAVDAIPRAEPCRHPIVMVTNQSGVARGFFSEAVVESAIATCEAILRQAVRTSMRTTTVPITRTVA